MYNQRNKTVCSPLLHMRALRSFYFSFSASGDLCPQYNSKADTRLPNTVTSPRFSRTNDLVGLQFYQLLFTLPQPSETSFENKQRQRKVLKSS